MGIAIATTLPMMLYLRRVAAKKWMKTALTILFLMSIFSIIGTQSRGAFLSLVAFGGFFWLRSKHKFAILAAGALAVLPAIAFMPSKWSERMTTIAEAGEDASFMGRVDAWVINTKFALQRPLTGAGLRNPYQQELAMKVDPERAPRAKAAHSIYFEILGGSGFVGLSLYLSLLASAFFKTIRLQKSDAVGKPWASKIGYFAQMSLVVFGIGGASTSLEMWDGYLLVIAIVAATGRLTREETAAAGASIDGLKRQSWRGSARGGVARPTVNPTL
jgi:probable O-glycosylation ligase (exosortase A-associated)